MKCLESWSWDSTAFIAVAISRITVKKDPMRKVCMYKPLPHSKIRAFLPKFDLVDAVNDWLLSPLLVPLLFVISFQCVAVFGQWQAKIPARRTRVSFLSWSWIDILLYSVEVAISWSYVYIFLDQKIFNSSHFFI